MQASLFKELVKNAFTKRYALFDKKQHDYATEDCLSNFKRISRLCKELNINVATPEGTNLFYITMKFDRLCNLVHKGTTPQNESLDDTLNDIQNYIDLLRGLLHEKENKEPSGDGR